MAMPTIERVVSRYLFNSDVPPANLIDEGLIRAAGQQGDVIRGKAEKGVRYICHSE